MLNTEVQNYMTHEVFAITPDKSIEDCMQLMTAKKIRHLPVLENEVLIGLISIGDVVKELISSKELLITNLEGYIVGRGYGC